ncbi:unnamed protein product, partial [Polarella glacialis]
RRRSTDDGLDATHDRPHSAGRASTPGRAANRAPPEADFSFRPKITSLAKQREVRGTSDLSLGEQKRRDLRSKCRKEEFTKREAGRYSFKPQVNSYNGVGSRLRVLEEADTLIERMARSRQATLSRCQMDVTRIQEKTDAENTFHPQVKAAPELIRRMAESHRALRELRQQELHRDASTEKTRPAWQ